MICCSDSFAHDMFFGAILWQTESKRSLLILISANSCRVVTFGDIIKLWALFEISISFTFVLCHSSFSALTDTVNEFTKFYKKAVMHKQSLFKDDCYYTWLGSIVVSTLAFNRRYSFHCNFLSSNAMTSSPNLLWKSSIDDRETSYI